VQLFRLGKGLAAPCEEIGRRAAFLPMERIAAPQGARRTIRLDAALTLRDSCGRPR
jgi:LacI family transcriptional regulator